MVNSVTLIGNVGKDPELRRTKNDNAMCTFSLATSEKWQDKESGEQKERTDWHNIVCFGRTAETSAEYVSKGAQVFVEGKLQNDNWTDKDGNERKGISILARRVITLGSRRD